MEALQLSSSNASKNWRLAPVSPQAQDEASSHLNKSKSRTQSCGTSSVRKNAFTRTVIAILTVFFHMNITTSSRVQECVASCNSGNNFETNLPEDLVKHRATRRRKGSDLQMAQKLLLRNVKAQDTQDFSNGLQRSLRKQEVQTTLPNCERGHAEVQAQKRNKQMHIANGNTSPNAEK